MDNSAYGGEPMSFLQVVTDDGKVSFGDEEFGAKQLDRNTRALDTLNKKSKTLS